MTIVKVVMKDKRVFHGPLWLWRPEEGFFTLVLDHMHYPNIPKTEIENMVFRLDEVESAVDNGVRETIDMIVDVDLLARAREQGWK